MQFVNLFESGISLLSVSNQQQQWLVVLLLAVLAWLELKQSLHY